MHPDKVLQRLLQWPAGAAELRGVPSVQEGVAVHASRLHSWHRQLKADLCQKRTHHIPSQCIHTPLHAQHDNGTNYIHASLFVSTSDGGSYRAALHVKTGVLHVESPQSVHVPTR